MYTYDKRTIDSAGAFMLGELERLDKTIHMPLVSVTWGRDMDLRPDVTLADETSSFTNSFFSSPGGTRPTGKSWIGTNTSAIPGIGVNIAKTSQPMHFWGEELGYTIKELAAAEQTGRPLDSQKHDGIKLKYQMDVDEMVYIGDEEVNASGLCNNPAISPANVGYAWVTATPKQILDDINGVLNAAWEQTGFAMLLTHLLVSPLAMTRLTQPISEAGTKSILQYVREECLSNATSGRPLEINPVKWLKGRGVGGKDRMVAYTKGEQFVRYPLVPMQRTPIEYRGLFHLTTYYSSLGEVEFVYPETVAYADGM